MVADSEKYIPERGDVVWLNFDPQAGHEQAGRRPALVLSPGKYNHLTGLLLACPVTSRSKGYPFEVALPPDLPVAGVVLADYVKSLDWRSRNASFATQAGTDVVLEVTAKIESLLNPGGF